MKAHGGLCLSWSPNFLVKSCVKAVIARGFIRMYIPKCSFDFNCIRRG